MACGVSAVSSSASRSYSRANRSHPAAIRSAISKSCSGQAAKGSIRMISSAMGSGPAAESAASGKHWSLGVRVAQGLCSFRREHQHDGFLASQASYTTRCCQHFALCSTEASRGHCRPVVLPASGYGHNHDGIKTSACKVSTCFQGAATQKPHPQPTNHVICLVPRA